MKYSETVGNYFEQNLVNQFFQKTHVQDVNGNLTLGTSDWFSLFELAVFDETTREDLIELSRIAKNINYIKSKINELTEGEKKELNEIMPSIHTPTTKLKWLGTPAQFGFIIQELIGKGYLERPTSSFAKDAKIFLSIFDIETTEQTLAKELSDKTNSISPDNARLLSISYKSKLSTNNQKVAGK
jgi:hypothetical protein